MYKDVQYCTKNQIQHFMAKIHKHLTVEKETEKKLKELAKAEKRTEGVIVDLAIQAYAAQKKAAIN